MFLSQVLLVLGEWDKALTHMKALANLSPEALTLFTAYDRAITAEKQRDAVFASLGDALAAVQGVTIASKAQLLGSYDVSYGGADFLVRTSQNTDGVYVSAVDPRGLPDTREAPVALINQLKAALGGR